MYATIAYISFDEAINWSANALFISMVTLGIASSFVAMKYKLRILYLISTLGGLITPIILKASESHHFTLFMYLLVINVGVLYVSAIEKWNELKLISFISSIIIYSTYYFHFDPIAWGKPFFYVSSFFLVYMVGLMLSSWKEKDNFNGLNQYLGILNAINFVFWSNYIFVEFDIPHTFPMLVVGVVFVIMGGLIYTWNQKINSFASSAYPIIGILVMAIATSDTAMLLSGGMNYVLNTFIWIFLLTLSFFLVKNKGNRHLIYVIYAAYIILLAYWYSVAWDVDWIEMFGIPYIPFLNAGAIIWVLLSCMGFYFQNLKSNMKR